MRLLTVSTSARAAVPTSVKMHSLIHSCEEPDSSKAKHQPAADLLPAARCLQKMLSDESDEFTPSSTFSSSREGSERSAKYHRFRLLR